MRALVLILSHSEPHYFFFLFKLFPLHPIMMQSLVMTNSKYAGADPGLDPGFLERGFNYWYPGSGVVLDCIDS